MKNMLAALGAVNLKPVYTDADVWRDDTISVNAIHREAFDDIRHLLESLKTGGKATHIVIEGRPGIGKSHFLGRIRRLVVYYQGLFVLIQLNSARQFWESIALAYLDALFHQGRGDALQLDVLLEALGWQLELGATDRKALAEGRIDVELLAHVRGALTSKLGRGPSDRGTIDVALALVLLKSADEELYDIGYSFLQGLELNGADRKRMSISSRRINPREIIRAIDRVFGLAGKFALVALDQLDGLIALARSSKDFDEQAFVDSVANGLMDFASDVQHTLIVVSCLRDNWRLMEEKALKAAARNRTGACQWCCRGLGSSSMLFR